MYVSKCTTVTVTILEYYVLEIANKLTKCNIGHTGIYAYGRGQTK